MFGLFCKKHKYLCFILCGFYIFYLGNIFFNYIFIGAKWAHLFHIVGQAFLIIGFLKKKKSMRGCDKRITVIYYFFISVCLLNVVFGIPIVLLYGNFRNILYGGSLWLYGMGLFFLIPPKIENIPLVLKWCYLYLITSVLFALYCFTDFYLYPESVIDPNSDGISFSVYIINRPQEPAFLLTPIAFFLCFYKHFKLYWKILIPVAYFLALLALLFSGRRSASVSLLGYLIIPFLVFLWKKGMKSISCIVVISFFIFFIINTINIHKISNALEETFVVLSSRIDKDTRSGTEDDFYKDMNSLYDWIFGRGMNGTYYSPELASLDKPRRDVIETGFLNIVLHGGLLMLLPYVLMLLYSFWMGWFYSRNLFVKSCSLISLMYFLMLYPGGSPKIGMNFFLLFMFMRICVSEKWRRMSDSQIVNSIFAYKSQVFSSK